jgi:hypothetical protein
MHDFFRSMKSCSFYIKSDLVKCTERGHMIYLRGVRRNGSHEALHPKCYSGVRLRSRLRLSIIAKTSSCISTNCLRILHLTSWGEQGDESDGSQLQKSHTKVGVGFDL